MSGVWTRSLLRCDRSSAWVGRVTRRTSARLEEKRSSVGESYVFFVRKRETTLSRTATLTEDVEVKSGTSVAFTYRSRESGSSPTSCFRLLCSTTVHSRHCRDSCSSGRITQTWGIVRQWEDDDDGEKPLSGFAEL